MMNRLKRVDWLAAALYPLAVILMEAFWVYPWLVWLGLWPTFAELRPALSLTSIIIVLAVSLLVTRVSLRQKWPMWLIQGIVVGCGLVTIFLVLRVEYGAGYAFLDGRWFTHVRQVLGASFTHTSPIVLALPVLLYLWWRGIALGRMTHYFSNIYRSFLLGMVAIIVLIILWRLSSASGAFEGPVSNIGLYAMAFFFFGLMAMAIYHFYQTRRQMQREEATLASVWRWLLIMLGIIGGIVVVGLGVVSIFSAEVITGIGQGINVILGVLGKIFHYILIPFNYLFEGIFYVLKLIVSWLQSDQPLQRGNAGNMTMEGMPEVVSKSLPPEVILAIKWLVVALIIAAVIYLLAKAVFRYRAQRAQEEIEEIHESLWSLSGFRDDVRLFFNMMGQKFKRKPAPAAPPRYYIDEDILGRLDIREIYRHLLWEGARSGVARRSYETAWEYTGRLQQAVPDGSEQLAQLTDLYVDARYGEIRTQEEQVDSANSLWKTLRNLLRRLRGA
jgi:hypothetical protein